MGHYGYNFSQKLGRIEGGLFFDNHGGTSHHHKIYIILVLYCIRQNRTMTLQISIWRSCVAVTFTCLLSRCPPAFFFTSWDTSFYDKIFILEKTIDVFFYLKCWANLVIFLYNMYIYCIILPTLLCRSNNVFICNLLTLLFFE